MLPSSTRLLQKLEVHWPGLWPRMQACVVEAGPAWLVGGGLRDLLLGRPPADLDLACQDPEAWAKHLGQRVVVLDPLRTHLRVLGPGLPSSGVDLAPLRAPDIERDLLARDFTVNALALSLEDGAFLDPSNGLADLAAKALRATHADAFPSDPLRALRAHRLGANLGFQLRPPTRDLSRHWLSHMEVSAERIRAEWMSLLEAPKAPAWLKAHPELMSVTGPSTPQRASAWELACSALHQAQGDSLTPEGLALKELWRNYQERGLLAPLRNAALASSMLRAEQDFSLGRLSRRESRLLSWAGGQIEAASRLKALDTPADRLQAAAFLHRAREAALPALIAGLNPKVLGARIVELIALCSQAPSAPSKGAPPREQGPLQSPRPFLTGGDILKQVQDPRDLAPLLEECFLRQWIGELASHNEALAWAQGKISGNEVPSPTVVESQAEPRKDA